jgi:hypothetical protein
MHWLAWKPICCAVFVVGGGWVGYHHYCRHDHWDRAHWRWERGYAVRPEWHR